MPLTMLPAHVRALAKSWEFEPVEELPGGHCSRIFADLTRILKVPFDGEELTYGVDAALKLQGAGGPEVYQFDRETAAILMERMIPGKSLSAADLHDLECQQIFIEIAKRLPSFDPARGMPLSEYFAFDLPLLNHMQTTTEAHVFLHGDLHHANILLHEGNWRPIDPKGLVGDRHFECIAFLRNPINQLREVDDLNNFTEQRIYALAEALNLNPWRIAAWGFIDQFECDGAPDDPWVRLRAVYEDLETKLRS